MILTLLLCQISLPALTHPCSDPGFDIHNDADLIQAVNDEWGAWVNEYFPGYTDLQVVPNPWAGWKEENFCFAVPNTFWVVGYYDIPYNSLPASGWAGQYDWALLGTTYWNANHPTQQVALVHMQAELDQTMQFLVDRQNQDLLPAMATTFENNRQVFQGLLISSVLQNAVYRRAAGYSCEEIMDVVAYFAHSAIAQYYDVTRGQGFDFKTGQIVLSSVGEYFSWDVSVWRTYHESDYYYWLYWVFYGAPMKILSEPN